MSSETLSLLISKFYKKNEMNDRYILDKTIPMSLAEYDYLCENLIFSCGNVVLVKNDYPFGDEPNGFRLLLIIARVGTGELCAVPISLLTHQKSKKQCPNDAIIEINFYDESKDCYIAHIHRVEMISVNRINTTFAFGKVDYETMRCLIDRFDKYYGSM